MKRNVRRAAQIVKLLCRKLLMKEKNIEPGSWRKSKELEMMLKLWMRLSGSSNKSFLVLMI